MNKTAAIAGGVIVFILLMGALVSMNKQPITGETATSTTQAESSGNTYVTNQTTVVTTPIGTAAQASTPLAVTNANVAPTDTTAIVSGNVTANGALTSYWYEYDQSGKSFGKSTGKQVIGYGFAAIPAPAYITGLTKNTSYSFRLVAENSYGKTTGAAYSFTTSETGKLPEGDIPTIKTRAATTISEHKATLAGDITPNGANTQYWFEYGTTANLGKITALTSAGDANTKSVGSVMLSDLEAGTTYYFRINAQNQFGTVNGATLNFKTDAPAKASAPTATTKLATAVNTSSATLNGALNPGGAETKYWFEYSSDALLGSILLSQTKMDSAGAGTTVTPVSINVTGLHPRTTYYFRIVAQNSVGTVRGDRESFETK